MKVGRFELLDDRVLGAVRFIDAVTQLPIRDVVEIAGARTTQSASGFTVIRAPDSSPAELEHYFSRFRSAPHADEPNPGSIPLTLSVSTPGGRYLARQFTLSVPLQESDNTQPNYLFAPIEVTLYPAASYAIEPPWAIIRLRVVQQGVNPAVPLAGVLVSALTRPPAPSAVLGRGLSDRRGETLLVVPGLRPVTMENPEFTVDLEARCDNGNPTIPDPDRLINAAGDEAWLNVAQLANVVIAPGRRTVSQLSIA